MVNQYKEFVEFLENIKIAAVLQLTGFFGIIVSIYVNNQQGLQLSFLTLIFAIIITIFSDLFYKSIPIKDEVHMFMFWVSLIVMIVSLIIYIYFSYQIII